MEPDRTPRIGQLYHAALARDPADRPAFLAESCRDDPALRHEVERLLESAPPVTGFMETAVFAGAADLVGHSQGAPLTGRQLGPYRVGTLLGRGGMGEVYRAHDTKLARDVAIKVLPAAVAGDAERLARFQREARTLASLNDPHIAAIYGIEESGSALALILELVEGFTLAEMLGAGPLPLREALLIAQQMADGLDAAHAKGIIHRDLKPANVKVTPGGLVKLLDFGLAKVWAGHRPDSDGTQAPLTVTSMHTREGMIIGTVDYMSPEQARGQSLDRGTDVWAFGCVLFEMLCGRRPFAGDTPSDTIARILEREPDWSDLPASTPGRVRELLRQCLKKDQTARLDNMSDARAAVDATLTSPFKMPRAIAEAMGWQLSRPFVRWTLAALLLLLGGTAFYRTRASGTPMPQLTNPIQVTGAIGVEDHPTWSPDNRTLAYESSESGNWDIWLTSVGGGQAVNRTADHAGDDRYASWSPDGRQIAFWSARDGGGYYVMPALGGTAVRLVSAPETADYFHSPPEWSADGTQLATVSYAHAGPRLEPSLQIVSLLTRDVQRVPLPGNEEARLDLTWSRDGRYLAYVDAAQQASEVTQLRVLNLSNGQVTEATDGRTNARRPRWSPDARYLFYVANREGPSDLWRQAMNGNGAPAGAPERVTAGLEVRAASFSTDGARLAYSKGRWIANVWRVPILEDRPATWADAEQVTFEQAFIESVSVSPDRRRLLYSSDRTGNQDLWVMPIGGGTAVPLTAGQDPDWAPSWSADGRQITFYSYRTGDREIWTMPATGGAATQITKSKGLDAGSRWSPDGREIAYRSERTGNSEIWVTTVDGSRSRQITNDPAGDYLETWSPDGQWLAFVSTRTGRSQIWRVRSKGGQPELLTRGPGWAPRWSRDGAHIFFPGSDERTGNLWRFSFNTRSERPITSLTGKRGRLGIMQPDTDGTYIYFTWRDDVGDIWVMDVVRR